MKGVEPKWKKGSGFAISPESNAKIQTARARLLSWRSAEEVDHICRLAFSLVVPKRSPTRKTMSVPERLVDEYVQMLGRFVKRDSELASCRRGVSSLCRPTAD